MEQTPFELAAFDFEMLDPPHERTREVAAEEGEATSEFPTIESSASMVIVARSAGASDELPPVTEPVFALELADFDLSAVDSVIQNQAQQAAAAEPVDQVAAVMLASPEEVARLEARHPAQFAWFKRQDATVVIRPADMASGCGSNTKEERGEARAALLALLQIGHARPVYRFRGMGLPWTPHRESLAFCMQRADGKAIDGSLSENIEIGFEPIVVVAVVAENEARQNQRS